MKVKVFDDYASLGLNKRMVFYDDESDGKIAIHNLFTGVSCRMSMNEPIPDEYVMKIPYRLTDGLFSALAEFLDKNGIKTDNDHKIQGTLDAQRAHLEDLRKLLNLK